MARPSEPVFDYRWRLWFRKPNGFWTNGGTCRTYQDVQSAKAALELRGYETKPEYLGRYVGTNSRRDSA